MTTPLRRPAAVVLVTLAAAGILTVPAPSARANDAGQITVQLADAPLSRETDPRALVYIVDHVAAGASFTRHVRVTNDTSVTRSFSFYPGPAQIGGDAWTVGEAGARSELTDWITVGAGAFSLEPGESETVPVSFDVPADVSEGERYAVLCAATGSRDSGGSVALVSRVGVRVYLSAGPGAEPVIAPSISRGR